MKTLQACLAAVLLSWLALPAPAAAAKWTRLQSANFLFVGDADEREMRRIALKLEQFRETLIRAFGQGAGLAPVPTLVFVFGSDRSFTPYKPLYRGKPVEVGGYFQGGEHVNYIALMPGRESDDYRTIFHEYTHFVVNNMIGAVPAWINEGLAEFYETFEERNNGRVVLIGRPSGEHIRVLQGRPMPLAELMSVDRSSPVYNEGDRRGIFYAQSWALVHYLLGNPARSGQLTAYLNQIRAGAAPSVAFSMAFKTDMQTLEEELRNYLSRFLFPATEFKFPERTGSGGVQPGSTIEEPEARAYLAELLALTGRPDDARILLEGLPPGTSNARALNALGTLELRAGRKEEGMALLERAAAAAPTDAWIQGTYGRAFADQLRATRGDRVAQAALLPKARAALKTAVSLSPVSVSTLVDFALVELESGGDFAGARALLEAAIRQAPAREGYRLLYAQVLMNQGEFDASLALLKQLETSASQPAVREQARSFQDVVGQRRQRLAEIAARNAEVEQRRAELAGRRILAPPIADAPVAPGAGDAAGVPPTSPDSAPRRVLALREVSTGEERVRARFEAVECTNAGLRLRFRSGTDTVRFSAPRLDQIDFVSYRDDTAQAVKCGVLPAPLEALVTFRPTASGQTGLRGEVIAVELIPDDYVLSEPMRVRREN
jgi:tetratricopeptide (TPR) repeat protein